MEVLLNKGLRMRFNILNLKKKFLFKNNRRAQVFLISTFLLVAYAIPIMITLSELKTVNIEESKPDLFQYINEYNTELNYQLQKIMYLRTNNGSTNTLLFSTLQLFQQQFEKYLFSNGITATFTVNSTNLVISADNGPTQPIGMFYEKIIFVKVHVGVILTSSVDNSKLVTNINSYYGIKAFINENSTNELLGLGQINSNGNIINYINNAEFSINVQNLHNGYYNLGVITNQTAFICTLSSGIKFYS